MKKKTFNNETENFERGELLDFSLKFLKKHDYYKTKIVAQDFISSRFNLSRFNQENQYLLKKMVFLMKDMTRRFKQADFITEFGTFTYKIIKENVNDNIANLKIKLNKKIKKKCIFCGKMFDKLGIKSHIKYCKKRRNLDEI